MPRYRITRRNTEYNAIVVEASSEEELERMDEEGKFDSVWDNAEWDDCSHPEEVEVVDDDEPLTEPYKPARQEDIDKILAYVKGE